MTKKKRKVKKNLALVPSEGRVPSSAQPEFLPAGVAENLPLSIDEQSFKSMKEVKEFVFTKQLSRRNLQPLDAKYYRGQLYNLLKVDPSKKGKMGDRKSVV